MIIIGIVLLSVGLLVSLLAFRGRVVARGQFCRKCRFDLAGLDIESPQAKCPECGSETHQDSARRTQLRRMSRTGTVIAAILLLVGTSGVWVGAIGKTNTIIAAMPDPIVLWLTDLGVDKALDELVVRTSRVPNTMSAKSWDHAIELGLDFQADKQLTWDVRWGEVLFLGLDHGHMSDDQLGRFFLNVYQIDLAVRDRVHPGASGFGYQLTRELARWKMLTGGQVSYRFGSRVVSYGIVGKEPIWEASPQRQGGRGGVGLYPYSSNKMSMWTKTSQMNEYLAQSPGESIDVFFEYEATLKPMDVDDLISAHRVRKEFTIHILDPDEPIVPAYTDEVAAQLVLDNVGIGPLQIISEIEDAQSNTYIDILTATLRSKVGFAPLALDIFLVVDGEEVQVGDVHLDNSPNSFGAYIGWSIKPGDANGLALAQTAHGKLIVDQLATIIVRTNPELVDDIPGIDRVLDVEFMFVDVPVQIVESDSELMNPDWEAARIKAQPIDE